MRKKKGNKKGGPLREVIEKKWILFGGDSLSARFWNPITKQIASAGYMPRNGTINSSDVTLSIMIRRCSSFLTKDTGIIVMHVLYPDLIRRAKDITLTPNDGLLKARRAVDLEELAQQIVEADSLWKKFIPDLKVVWTLPISIGFLEYNTHFVKKNKQNLLSEREARACQEYTEIFQDNLHQLEMIFSVQYPEIEILKLDDLLSEEALGVKVEKNGPLFRFEGDECQFAGPYVPLKYTHLGKKAFLNYLVDKNFMPMPGKEVKPEQLGYKPNRKIKPKIENDAASDGKVDEETNAVESMDETESCKTKQAAPTTSENSTVLLEQMTLTTDQDSEEVFEGFEEADKEIRMRCFNENNASKMVQYICTADDSGFKSTAIANEDIKIELREANATAAAIHDSPSVEVPKLDSQDLECPSVDEPIMEVSLHQLSDFEGEASTVAHDLDQSSEVDAVVDHQTLDLQSKQSIVNERLDGSVSNNDCPVGNSEQSPLNKGSNFDVAPDSVLQTSHKYDGSQNIDVKKPMESNENISLAHDSQQDDMCGNEGEKPSKSEVRKTNHTNGESLSQALTEACTTDQAVVSNAKEELTIKKEAKSDVPKNGVEDIMQMDDDELLYEDAPSDSDSFEEQKTVEHQRPSPVQEVMEVNEKHGTETPVAVKLEGSQSVEVSPLLQDPADVLLAKYYKEVPTCQEYLMKKEHSFIGLQFIAELRTIKTKSSVPPIYVCILCNKQIASQTVLVSHANSVPHKLKCAKLHLPVVHKRYGAIPLPEWTATTLTKFREDLHEAASHLMNYRIGVVNKEEFNEASSLITDNFEKLDAFPRFTLDTINKLLIVASVDEKLEASCAGPSSADGSVPSVAGTKQMPQDAAVKTESLARARGMALEVPVLIVGDNSLLCWPPSDHPVLSCSVHCQETTTLPALIRMAGRMLNAEHKVLVMVAFLHDLIHQQDGFWFLKPKIDVNRLAMDVENAIRFWEMKYPTLTVVWALPHALNLQQFNRTKLEKSDEELTDQDKTMLGKSSENTETLNLIRSELKNRLNMSESWPVSYGLGDMKQVELVDGFHPTGKSLELLLKELEDFLLVVLEEHPDYAEIIHRLHQSGTGGPTRDEERRKEIKTALNHRRARMVSKFGVGVVPQPQQPSPPDAVATVTPAPDASVVSDDESSAPPLSQTEVQQRLQVVRERLGMDKPLLLCRETKKQLLFQDTNIAAYLTKCWDSSKNEDSSKAMMKTRINRCVYLLNKLHRILLSKQNLFNEEASSHPDYDRKWFEFHSMHSTKLSLNGIDTKTYDFSEDWLLEWHRYVVIILNNELDKERQRILKVFGFANIKAFEKICRAHKIQFTIKKLEIFISSDEFSSRTGRRHERKRLMTPMPQDAGFEGLAGNFLRPIPSLLGPSRAPPLIDHHASLQDDPTHIPLGSKAHASRLSNPTHAPLGGSDHALLKDGLLRNTDTKQDSGVIFDVFGTLSELDRMKEFLPSSKDCIADLFIDAKNNVRLKRDPLDIFHLNKKNIHALHQIYMDLCKTIDGGHVPPEVYKCLEGVRWTIEEIRKREFCGISLFKIARETEGFAQAEILEIVDNALIESKLSTNMHMSMRKEFMEIIQKIHAKAIDEKVRKVVGNLKVSTTERKGCDPVAVPSEMQTYLTDAVDNVFSIHRDNSLTKTNVRGSRSLDEHTVGIGPKSGSSDQVQHECPATSAQPAKLKNVKPPGWTRWVAPGIEDVASDSSASFIGTERTCVSHDSGNSRHRGAGRDNGPNFDVADQLTHSEDFSAKCRGYGAEESRGPSAKRSYGSSQRSDHDRFSEAGRSAFAVGFNRFDDENVHVSGRSDRKRDRDQSFIDHNNPNKTNKRVKHTHERGGNSRSGPETSRGGPGNSHGRPGNSHGRPGNNHGRPGNSLGGSRNSCGGPGNSHGRPRNSLWDEGHSHGDWGNSRERPGSSRGRENSSTGHIWDYDGRSTDDPPIGIQDVAGHSSAHTSPLERQNFPPRSCGPTSEGYSRNKTGPSESQSIGPTGFSDSKSRTGNFASPTPPPPQWLPLPKTPALAENSAFGGRLGVAASNWLSSSASQLSSNKDTRPAVRAPINPAGASPPQPVPPPSTATQVNIKDMIGNIIGSVDMTSNLALPSKVALNRTLSSMQLRGIQSFSGDSRPSANPSTEVTKSTRQDLKDIIAAHFQDFP